MNAVVCRSGGLDIQPWVPRFDLHSTDRVDCFGPRLAQLPSTRSDDRTG
jgi:hypothetical protein